MVQEWEAACKQAAAEDRELTAARDLKAQGDKVVPVCTGAVLVVPSRQINVPVGRGGGGAL